MVFLTGKIMIPIKKIKEVERPVVGCSPFYMNMLFEKINELVNSTNRHSDALNELIEWKNSGDDTKILRQITGG